MEPQQNRDLKPEYLSLNIGEINESMNPVRTPIFTDFDSPESARMVGNRYLIDNYVGSGTRDEIYEAIDQQISKAARHEQRTSIELLALRENQVPLVGRFASRFAKLVNIPHTSIARSIDFGVDNQSVFFTMELLEGMSLRSILDGSSTEAFSENEVIAVIRSVADALTHMHKHGFTHGNLTPDSIFVTHNLDVKIIDFASEVLKQSFDIMASRQTDSSKPLKPVEDVYGLAAIAYEMLAGEPAYDGISRTQACRKGIKLRPVGRLSRHRRKALTRALALRFDKRTPTVVEFVEEFGVTGNENLHVPIPDRKANSNRMLKPLAALVALDTIAAFLQPSFDVISDKLSDWRNLVIAQVSQDPIIAEQSNVVSAPGNNSPAEEAPVVETAEAPPTLAEQVEQSLEGEIAEYIAQDEEADPMVTAKTGVAGITSEISDEKTLQASAIHSSLENDALQVKTEFIPASTVFFEKATDNASIDVIEAVAIPAAAAELSLGDIVFDKQSLTVNESQSMAAVSLRRNGGTNKSASVIWWTGENTAQTDVDYAELGVRTEIFSAGQKIMTVYIPIVSDSVIEGTESFYVYAQSDLALKNEVSVLEVIVVDDDG
jgi:serine/threonine protein kinase